MKIETVEQYKKALERAEELFNFKVGTPEGDELDAIADAVEVYEEEHSGSNTNNPMYRRDIWSNQDYGYSYLESEECEEGDYVACECVIDYIQSLQEQGLSPEEILNKIVEELS